jgi:membrane protein implicated in regulation of membrane protease activity
MKKTNSPIEAIKQPIKQVTSHLWFERLARLGYAAKGLVYLIVGLLAMQAAIGSGGRITNTSGALQVIVTQPFGKFLLSIVTLGIIGYVLWRLVQTFFDPIHRGQSKNAKQIVKRIGYGCSAIAYTGLAFTAAKLIMDLGSADSETIEDWTEYFLTQPFGRWLVLLVGMGVIGVGIVFLFQAYKAKFRHHLKLQQMSSSEQSLAIGFGRFGIASRGIVFGIIGIFLILAAIHINGSEAKGLGGVLTALGQLPFGSWVLGTVAFGLMAYGIYSLIEAYYRRITNSDKEF